MPRFRTLTISLLLIALVPATARATTVTTETKTVFEGRPSDPYTVIHVVDADGRANALSGKPDFNLQPDPATGRATSTFAIRDDNGGLTAGDGCSGGGQDVTCKVWVGFGPDVDVEAGGGDDIVRIEGGGSQHTLIHGGDGDDRLSVQIDGTLYGDGGDDVLTGGTFQTTYDGGSGDDTFIGTHDGTDTVSYATRTAPVTARIGTSGNGEAGENDTIDGEIEALEGGAGDDTLVGDARGNRISGLGGADHIDGGGGNDYVDGDHDVGYDKPYPAGADVLVGGDGDDRLTVGSGGSADGQAGNDVLLLEGTGITATGGSGRDGFHAEQAGARLFAGDGERDRLECSAPAVAVDADDSDIPTGCGSAVHRSRPGAASILALGNEPLGGPHGPQVQVACADDAPAGCPLQLTGVVSHHLAGTLRTTVPRGTTQILTVPEDEISALRLLRDQVMVEMVTLQARDTAGIQRFDQQATCVYTPDEERDRYDPPPPGLCNAPTITPAPALPQLGRLRIARGYGGRVALRADADPKDAGSIDCAASWGDGAKTTLHIGLRPRQPAIRFAHRYRGHRRYRVRVTCEDLGFTRTRYATIRIGG
jgi:hypothetical protein